MEHLIIENNAVPIDQDGNPIPLRPLNENGKLIPLKPVDHNDKPMPLRPVNKNGDFVKLKDPETDKEKKNLITITILSVGGITVFILLLLIWGILVFTKNDANNY